MRGYVFRYAKEKGTRMDVHKVLDRLRQRRREILSQLPPRLNSEFRDLETTIGCVEQEIASLRPSPAQPESSCGLFDPPRPRPVPELNDDARTVPLAERKIALVKYLNEHGPKSRADILRETGIPAGSLSALLTRGVGGGM